MAHSMINHVIESIKKQLIRLFDKLFIECFKFQMIYSILRCFASFKKKLIDFKSNDP